MAMQHAAEVAGETMALAQALGLRPAQSYAIVFKEVRAEEVMLALARTQAASGNVNEAMAWAKQIGSNGKVDSDKDNDGRMAVEQRLYALIGVAEGILDDRASSTLMPDKGR
jgi:hypothetical protein